MKKKDIEVLTRVAEKLEILLPVGEYALFVEFMEICDRYTEEYKKASVNRKNSTATWKKKNPEEYKKRQKEYNERWLKKTETPDVSITTMTAKTLRQKVQEEAYYRNSTSVLISYDKLKAIMAERDCNISELIFRAKISRRTIDFISKGKKSRLSTADKIAKALGVKSIELLT